MDFKESGFMYAVALGVVAFVIAQSIFFIVKAWKRGKQLGLSGEKMKNTIVSSILSPSPRRCRSSSQSSCSQMRWA